MWMKALALIAGFAVPAIAYADANATSVDVNTDFTLAYAQDNGDDTTGGGDDMPVATNWDIEGPYSMRGADVQEVGTMDLKVSFGWATSSDGTDDDIGFTPVLQYGIAENHELIFSLPVNIGDGEMDKFGNEGNGNFKLGWQWKIVDECEGCWAPAVAVFNEVTFPTGHGAAGVNWQLMGVFTKTVAEGTRVHLNPFMRVIGQDIDSGTDDFFGYSINGDERTGRDFAAGVVVGMDHKFVAFDQDMILNADYVLDSGYLDGYSMQHSAEVGVDWLIDDTQTLSFLTTIGLDGDSQGDNFGLGFQYAIALDAPFSF